MINHFRQGIKNIPEICARHGVKKVIIAPGSRNAPLIFAFTAQTELECLSMTDERSAAYFALGIALQSAEPVALVCTSGTAVLNFALNSWRVFTDLSISSSLISVFFFDTGIPL